MLSKIKIIKLCRYFKQILIKNTLLSNIVFCFAPYFRRANTVRRYIEIEWTITMLRSGIKVFDLKNYLHEWGAEALGYWLLEEIGLLFKLYNFKYAYF